VCDEAVGYYPKSTSMLEDLPKWVLMLTTLFLMHFPAPINQFQSF